MATTSSTVSRRSRGLPAVLAMLMTTGWAANHFAALLPVLRTAQNLSASLVAGLYGLYAVGLLPGLLLGGSASDRLGRRAVAVPGALLAAVGTLVLLFWHDPTGLVVGRLVVGAGAGATFSAGTAWAADLGGAAGVTRAGVFLTLGFATGPVVSGVLAEFAPAPLVVPFVLSAVLSLVAVAAAAAVPGRVPHPPPHAVHPAAHPPAGPTRAPRSVGAALSWALPVAPWVFAGATVGVVTLPARLPANDGGPLLAGIAAGIVLGTGVAVQAYARRRNLGPGAGVVGAFTAAAGLLLAGVGGSQPGLGLVGVAFLLLGAGYGLCLRAGLLDLERWAPPAGRGTLTGLFYLATYSGFAVPVALAALEPVAGPTIPLLVLGALAGLVAVLRWMRITRIRA
ncbi:MFS transporter [Nakamurella sp.]|uniref:MFS transporter n=1 Tax=Nakamurella sp. TaxID=1869182 RepID=UPI003783CF24